MRRGPFARRRADAGFRISAASWNRSVASLEKLYRWAELEGLLLSHPAVADAAVIPSPDEEAGEVPKAFVVLRQAVAPADLMNWVAARVAPHKKIRRLAVVDAIPKSASGKILRRVLVEQERARRV